MMDFSNSRLKNDSHQRTIIHLDMDCFYAQVEEIRNPALRTLPVGIQQKNIVVTCNYIARSKGVEKLMLVDDAQILCPDMVLVNGEDLTPYRQMSQRIFDILLSYSPFVEKLGFDENFVDISSLVESREQKRQDEGCDNMEVPNVVGHIYPPDGTTLNACSCGCALRLVLGSQIAQEIRKELYNQLGLKCCAGISYNKLLSKLVGARNKPNQQTVLVSSHAEQFMRELGELHCITGIGKKTETLLVESGVRNVLELQSCDMDLLKKKFGYETATKLKDIAFGRDTSAVRTTGKPKTISLEDSCKPISVRTDVEDRYRLLLMRLMEQVSEDGRVPICVKVVLRKFDVQKKSSHRETKQANILPSLFKTSSCTDTGGPKVMLADGAQDKLLKIIMRLFERVVDLSKPFNITLIGLAFSKFQHRKVGSSSIASFLIKKADLEVQSITSLTNTDVCGKVKEGSISVICNSEKNHHDDEAFRSSPTTFKPSDQFYRRRTAAASPVPMLLDNGSESGATNSDFSDISETEVEPSPKKSKLSRLMINKRRCFGTSVIQNEVSSDVASPSKLRVCDLRLNSRDSDRDLSVVSIPAISCTSSEISSLHEYSAIDSSYEVNPSLVRLNVFPYTNGSLPHQQENPSITNDTAKVMLMDDSSELCVERPSQNITANISGNLSDIPCPAGVDPQVFSELPFDVQNELIASWRSSLAAAAAAVANVGKQTSGNLSSTKQASTATSTTTKTVGTVGANGAQKNTLYRYFLRNK